MSDALARIRRLRPDVVGDDRYWGHHSQPRHDPQARAALVHVLRHMEIYADCFWRRDIVEAALRVAPSEVTPLCIAADLQRLIICQAGVRIVRRRGDPRDGTGPKLTTNTAGSISWAVELEIDDALGRDVFLMTRRGALSLLADDTERGHVVLAPDRRRARALAMDCGVEAIPVRRWIAVIDRALMELETPEPLWRYWSSRTLVVDQAWMLFNVDVLLILELRRRLCMDLILVDDVSRFPFDGPPLELIYSRRKMPPPPRRGLIEPPAMSRWLGRHVRLA